MGVMLESMAIAMPVVNGHPNRVGFRGVLTMVDVASDRPPAGARGHRVLLTRRAAEAAIPSLLGMALDYTPTLDRHDARRKVGVITRAEIVGRAIEVDGFLYAHDFPEIVEELTVSRQPSAVRIPRFAKSGKGGAATVSEDGRGRPSLHTNPDGQDTRRSTGLGMSYEIADAQIEDMHASVWVLNRVTFTGAAILLKAKAAYRGTWIELSAE